MPQNGDFTEKQVGKRVVAQNGSEVGTVVDIRDGNIYVEVSEDADRDVLDDLRWGGPVNREEHHLRQKHISTITDDTIRVRV